jgi:hypothetical protein
MSPINGENFGYAYARMFTYTEFRGEFELIPHEPNAAQLSAPKKVVNDTYDLTT